MKNGTSQCGPAGRLGFLRQRGPGELLGQAQSGLPDFKFGNLIEDWRLIQKARELVARHG